MKIIFECIAGSTLYGTSTKDSDKDTRGVFIPDKKYFLGLSKIEQIEDKTTDTTHFEIRKFFDLSLQCNPNIIELLFVPKSMITVCTKEWEEIISNRNLFLSKKARYTFSGYAVSQLKKMRKLEEKYDTKNALHLYRLITEGEELLLTGNITFPRPDYELLLEIRNGKYSYDELMGMIGDVDNEFDMWYNESCLPDKPDFNKVEELCIKLVERNLWSKLKNL